MLTAGLFWEWGFYVSCNYCTARLLAPLAWSVFSSPLAHLVLCCSFHWGDLNLLLTSANSNLTRLAGSHLPSKMYLMSMPKAVYKRSGRRNRCALIHGCNATWRYPGRSGEAVSSWMSWLWDRLWHKPCTSVWQIHLQRALGQGLAGDEHRSMPGPCSMLSLLVLQPVWSCMGPILSIKIIKKSLMCGWSFPLKKCQGFLNWSAKSFVMKFISTVFLDIFKSNLHSQTQIASVPINCVGLYCSKLLIGNHDFTLHNFCLLDSKCWTWR